MNELVVTTLFDVFVFFGAANDVNALAFDAFANVDALAFDAFADVDDLAFDAFANVDASASASRASFASLLFLRSALITTARRPMVVVVVQVIAIASISDIRYPIVCEIT